MTLIIPSVVATGESALTVVFGQTIDMALNDRVLALDQALVDDPVPGVSEVVPALASLLVRFDPLSVSRSDLSPRCCSSERIVRSTRLRPEAAGPFLRAWGRARTGPGERF